ncbi:hypothetical protein L249_7541 [Ophiocordyceps polyrhachis-furcata BCC 54312]|uniref:Uncharacterized protein n=1 Tax=Ophiocordyceps polyrhachis-furcata BCC 54312 TaxID=1330021 RepID=A0A367LAG0_9HYPO|nr:hypothetical protein L249_7541 [Ophiocordyceps polyrhachis-furcata BCC 54312]
MRFIPFSPKNNTDVCGAPEDVPVAYYFNGVMPGSSDMAGTFSTAAIPPAEEEGEGGGGVEVEYLDVERRGRGGEEGRGERREGGVLPPERLVLRQSWLMPLHGDTQFWSLYSVKPLGVFCRKKEQFWHSRFKFGRIRTDGGFEHSHCGECVRGSGRQSTKAGGGGRRGGE